MAHYSIKDVETLSGVKAHTLRIWEQRYAFLKPQRTETNIRYYNDEQLRMLLNVSVLNKNGFKISRIADMQREEVAKAVLALETGTDADQMVSLLVQAMVNFDEVRFEKVVSNAILKLGVHDAFTNLIFPFMTRAGVLWATGAASVSQEHFISHLITRKLYSAIDGLLNVKADKAKKYLLFLPEGEGHEMLLLFTEYYLKRKGHQVLYLGASLPYSELFSTAKVFLPDVIVTYSTVPNVNYSAEKFIKILTRDFPNIRIGIGGRQFDKVKLSPGRNVKLVNSIEQLELLSS